MALVAGTIVIAGLLAACQEGGTGAATTSATSTSSARMATPAPTTSNTTTQSQPPKATKSTPRATKVEATAGTGASTTTASAAALKQLATLPVKGRAPKTGYDRQRFGSAWTDDVTVGGGHNGCDTRNDILARDLISKTYKPGTHNCVVLTGTLQDPYTRRAIAFQRGQRTSTAVQIDHLVALSNAWQTGAQQLSVAQRTNLANDPLNLQAVDGPTNMSKGDGDAATWLPPNKSYRCTYVARQVQVKAKYHLWVTSPERAAISRILSNCKGTGVPAAQPVPSRAAAKPAPRTTKASPRPTARRTTVAPPKPARPKPTRTAQPPAGNVYYKNCDAVRAAGKAPIHRGDPGYTSKLDRDGDGVGCE